MKTQQVFTIHFLRQPRVDELPGLVSLAIGTAPTNDLVLADDTVSRRHCMISVQRDRYVVRDLESTNGTIVDGTPVLEAFLAPDA